MSHTCKYVPNLIHCELDNSTFLVHELGGWAFIRNRYHSSKGAATFCHISTVGLPGGMDMMVKDKMADHHTVGKERETEAREREQINMISELLGN